MNNQAQFVFDSVEKSTAKKRRTSLSKDEKNIVTSTTPRLSQDRQSISKPLSTSRKYSRRGTSEKLSESIEKEDDDSFFTDSEDIADNVVESRLDFCIILVIIFFLFIC